MRFFGTSVNLVINFEGGDPFKVIVTIDGQPLAESSRGEDVQEEQDGTTSFLVDEARMYNLLQLPEYGGHDLKLSSNSDRFSVFAFTFGSYSQGP